VYLISPWTISLHFWTLEAFSCHFGSECGAWWKLLHVNALTKINQLQPAVRAVQYWSHVFSIRYRRSSTNTNYQHHNIVQHISIKFLDSLQVYRYQRPNELPYNTISTFDNAVFINSINVVSQLGVQIWKAFIAIFIYNDAHNKQRTETTAKGKEIPNLQHGKCSFSECCNIWILRHKNNRHLD